MAVKFLLTGTGTDEDVTQTYYAYLRRESDGLYYDGDDGTFKVFASLVDGTLDMVEDTNIPGLWELTVPLTTGDTGTYSFLPKDGLTDYLVGTEAEHVWLVDGARQQSVEREKELLHTDYGGINTFQVLDEDGDPLEGAVIRVFDEASYDANDLDNPVGLTHTGTRGEWLAPIPVSKSATYVIHVHKENVSGPDTVEVIVP